MPAPEPDELLACRPSPMTTAPAGHGIRPASAAELHGRRRTALRHRGIRRPPAARWCARTAAGRRRASRRPSRVGAPPAGGRPVAADAQQHAPRRDRGRGATAAGSVGATSVRRTTRRKGDPPPRRRRRGRRGPAVARHGRGVVGGGPGELHLAGVVHPHRPARVAGRGGRRWRAARRAPRRAGRCCPSRKVRPGDLAPPRVQQAAAARDRAHHADRPAVAQHPQERAGQRVGAVRGLGLDELVPAVDQDEDRRPVDLRPLAPSGPARRRRGAGRPRRAGAGRRAAQAALVVAAHARAEMGERVEVGQRAVGVDDVQVQRVRAGVGRRGERRAPAGRSCARCPTRRRAATARRRGPTRAG